MGEYLLFSDVDLLTPIEEVEKLFVALSEPCDIAIASRMLPGSRVEVYQPWYRENMERLFNVPVRGPSGISKGIVTGVRDFPMYGRTSA